MAGEEDGKNDKSIQNMLNLNKQKVTKKTEIGKNYLGKRLEWGKGGGI